MSLVIPDISLSPGVLSQVSPVCMSPISRWWGWRVFWCGTQRARIRLHTSPRQRRECHPSSHWFWIMHPAHHGPLGVEQRVLLVKSGGNSDSGLIGIRNWRWSSSLEWREIFKMRRIRYKVALKCPLHVYQEIRVVHNNQSMLAVQSIWVWEYKKVIKRL